MTQGLWTASLNSEFKHFLAFLFSSKFLKLKPAIRISDDALVARVPDLFWDAQTQVYNLKLNYIEGGHSMQPPFSFVMDHGQGRIF